MKHRMVEEVGRRPREIKGRRLALALDHLAAADPDLGRALGAFGPPPPRSGQAGFAGLLDIIVSQQVSAAAADAILGRLMRELDGDLSAMAFLALDDAAFGRAGFSRRKVVYCRELARAIVDRRLDLDRVARLSDDEAIAALTAQKGLGRWSAEIYLLFALHRPDILPADDLALRIAAARVKRLRDRPAPAALRRMAEPWRPWRSVAARLLWHCYRSA